MRCPTIDIAGVTRRFGGLTAVANISLQVAAGEFLSLLGPSGCGKTTLLRLIGGFEMPDEGKIHLLGEDVTHLPPERRRTNLVFQSLALFPHMSVAENVAFGLRMSGVPGGTIARKVNDALALVRLENFGSRRVQQLSGGQRQRVAIARAIVNEPAVLLLDEPLGALDLRLRQELQTELRRLQRALGSPFIFVTHDQSEAMAMSDRVAVMNRGGIEQVATPRALYDQPASLFVARFVGNSNLLPGTVLRRDGRGADVRWAGGVVPCLGPGDPGQRVVLCIRHEALRLEPNGEARVLDRVFLGPTVRTSVRLPSGDILVAEAPIGRGQPVPEVDQAVGVAWEPESVQLFVAEEEDHG